MPYITADVTEHGPVIAVLIGVTEPRRQLLQKLNMPVPRRVEALALLDTGSSICLVDPKISVQLGLHPTGKTSIVTASTGLQPHDCDEYDVSLTLTHPDAGIELLFEYVPV